jgi:8-oxo-dGTP diphosphatase
MIYPSAIATVDTVLFTIVAGELHLFLLRRDIATEPFAGMLALPGGYVRTGTDADSRATARRILEHKTNIRVPYLEQLYTFSGPDRDPRGWSLSVAYYALVNEKVMLPHAIKNGLLVPVSVIPELAFDHNEIVDVALKRLRDKSRYSALPCYLLPPEFTLPELQATYEITMGCPLDKSSFRRKLDELEFLELLEGKLKAGKHRPAQLYRVRKDKSLVLFDRTV